MAAPDPIILRLRDKCLDGTVTEEEYARVIGYLRGERRAAEELSLVKKAKGKKRKEVEDDAA